MDSGTESTTAPAALPPEFPMSVQGGMLEALGINMYTTIGKCLVEFVANAFDGDARNVWIIIPVEAIGDARSALRAQAKAEVADGNAIRSPFYSPHSPTTSRSS